MATLRERARAELAGQDLFGVLLRKCACHDYRKLYVMPKDFLTFRMMYSLHPKPAELFLDVGTSIKVPDSWLDLNVHDTMIKIGARPSSEPHDMIAFTFFTRISEPGNDSGRHSPQPCPDRSG